MESVEDGLDKHPGARCEFLVNRFLILLYVRLVKEHLTQGIKLS